MLRIALALVISQSVSLKHFDTDVVSPQRCTEVGYTKLYEDVAELVTTGVLQGSDRYYIIMAMRHEMCGKLMLAKYEYGLEEVTSGQQIHIQR